MTMRLCLVAAALLLPSLAHAQAGKGGIAPVVDSANRQEKREIAPPALPGARADQNPIAPSDRPTADLRPTDALFDAINRGDIAVAKDALSRGAELNATNVLGLTPLELAIDLGRNDISFLLLSMRGASGPSRASVQQGGAGPDTPPVPTPAQRRAEQAADRRAQQMAQREARGTGRPGLVPTQATQAPPLFAGNGGTPNPQAGFVGFGR